MTLFKNSKDEMPPKDCEFLVCCHGNIGLGKYHPEKNKFCLIFHPDSDMASLLHLDYVDLITRNVLWSSIEIDLPKDSFKTELMNLEDRVMGLESALSYVVKHLMDLPKEYKEKDSLLRRFLGR